MYQEGEKAHCPKYTMIRLSFEVQTLNGIKLDDVSCQRVNGSYPQVDELEHL